MTHIWQSHSSHRCGATCMPRPESVRPSRQVLSAVEAAKWTPLRSSRPVRQAHLNGRRFCTYPEQAARAMSATLEHANACRVARLQTSGSGSAATGPILAGETSRYRAASYCVTRAAEGIASRLETCAFSMGTGSGPLTTPIPGCCGRSVLTTALREYRHVASAYRDGRRPRRAHAALPACWRTFLLESASRPDSPPPLGTQSDRTVAAPPARDWSSSSTATSAPRR